MQIIFQYIHCREGGEYIHTTLEQNLKCLIELKTVTITALHGENFLHNISDSPDSLSFFILPNKDPLSAS